MDEFFERIDELDPDESDVILTAAYSTDADTQILTLHFLLQGQTWAGDRIDEQWKVVPDGVAQHRLALEAVNPSVETEYARLRERQVSWVSLMFAAAPSSEDHLMAGLRRVHHEEEWGPFGRFGLGGQLSFGSGVFAVGPRPLMEAYREILEAEGMRPSELWPGPHPEHHRSPPPVLCLHLNGTVWVDDTFILAQSFHATRLP